MYSDESLFIDALKRQGLYRKFRTIDGYDSPFFYCSGKKYLNFGSNNYLNLSQHPLLIKTLQDSTEKWGVGSHSSRYICGHHVSHDNLEREIAQWLHSEDALFFNSAYSANLAVTTSLFSDKDLILMDRSCHASLIDGIRMSRTSYKVFRHNDMDHLEICLKRYRNRAQSCWLVVESIYSMDGDRCPLHDLIFLKNKYNCRILLDESHATGLFGAKGEGLAVEMSCEREISVRVTGLGKSVGVLGGVLCSSKTITDVVRNKGRTSIYTTAMPIPIVECLRQAIKLVADSHEQRSHIHKLSQSLKWNTPIVPFYVDGIKKVLNISQKFWERGLFVPAMRFPTVPKKKERLRISLNTEHTEKHITILKTMWTELNKSETISPDKN